MRRLAFWLGMALPWLAVFLVARLNFYAAVVLGAVLVVLELGILEKILRDLDLREDGGDQGA